MNDDFDIAITGFTAKFVLKTFDDFKKATIDIYFKFKAFVMNFIFGLMC